MRFENPSSEECINPFEINPNAEGCDDPCTIDPYSPERDPCLIDPSLPECGEMSTLTYLS
jgi:hypothetical protein